jgi:DNA-binding XRE family transcriptional regulator
MLDNYWDDDAYTRIIAVTHDRERDQLALSFADGDTVTVATWRLLRSTNRSPDWEHMHVVDDYHIIIPVASGTGDLGSDETDVPGFTIRSMTDPLFAAHLARHAEEAARRGGERLRELRERRGLTIDEIASRTGMAARQILRIEQGRYTVSFTKREEIAAALGYTLGDLLPMEPVTSATTA